MKDAINVQWIGNMAFEALVDEHRLILDSRPEVGGQNKGPRPKSLLMVSLGGCTGMDVISILKKMKVEVTGFHVRVVGDLTEEHPKRYTALKLIYEFSGIDLPPDKLKRAVELSQEKYCGVVATLKDSCEITYEIRINEI
jgi:putative redox protein